MKISLNPTESYFDNALDSEVFSNLVLSIQLSEKSLSYSITDNLLNKFLAIVSYSFTEKYSSTEISRFISDLCLNEPLLKKNFIRIYICYQNNNFLFIPDELYSEEKIKDYLAFFEVDCQEMTVKTDYLQKFKFYNIYCVPEKIVKVFSEIFPKSKLYHDSTCFINSISHLYNVQSLKGEKLFISVDYYEMEIIAFKDGKFLLYNIFEYKTNDDFMYFIMLVVKQLELVQQKTEIILTGKISDNSSLFQLINKYFYKVNITKSMETINVGEVFKDVPMHHYFKLLNINKCEL